MDGVFLAAEAGNKDWSAASEGFIWSPVAVPWFLEPGLSLCLNVRVFASQCGHVAEKQTAE